MLTPLSARFLPFFPLFGLSLFHFHFFSNFSFPIFSSLILFILSLSFFSFLLLFSFRSLSSVEIKWGKLPPHLPSCHLSTPCFSLIFPLFFFILFIASCNSWLNVSHVFQVYHMALATCHSILVPYGIT